MHRLSERIALLETATTSAEEWRRLCATERWTPEFLRGVLQDAIDALDAREPEHPDATVLRGALAQQEANHATG